jgi:glycosyltransferase involved in cell wall biosynthesis
MSFRSRPVKGFSKKIISVKRLARLWHFLFGELVQWNTVRQCLVRLRNTGRIETTAKWREGYSDEGSEGHEGDAAFLAFVKSNLDPERYRKIYGDVAAAGADPVAHWVNHGLYEGRSMQGGVLVLRSKRPHEVLGAGWRCFTWRGEYIAFRQLPLSPLLQRQVFDQARHEPAVLPHIVGLDQVPYFFRHELLNRDGLDIDSILTAISIRPKIVVILPYLCVGRAAKYGADLTDALLVKGGGPALVLVTEETAEQARGWQNVSGLSPFRAASVVFWHDTCGRSHSNPRVLAFLLNALRPEHIVVIGSRLGLEAVERYGKGVSQFAWLYCAALGTDESAKTSVGAQLIRGTSPYALWLTDNEAMVATLGEICRELPGRGIAVLPSRVLPASDEVFGARVASRRRRAAYAGEQSRWALVSRCEPLKGTDVFAVLASVRPRDQFRIYGPCQTELRNGGLGSHNNIMYGGTARDVNKMDFSDYDGFVFTSLFGEMLTVALEMSQHAIPMVLPDDGEIRETFDDTAVLFVRSGVSVNDTAAIIGRALDRLAAMSAEERIAMIEAARKQALDRHAPMIHARSVSRLFGFL